nr:uncharacterized protein LOC121469948 [Taeniopygia guttata]
MEEEWECERDRELSQQGEVTSQDLGLQEEVTVQEFYQQQEEVTVEEVSPCGVVRRHEWHQCEVGVRVQRGDGAQRELEMFHWGLSQWDKEGETHQELSQLEVEGYQELYPLKEDVQVHLHMHQGEGDQREPELSQVADNRENELTQAKDYNVQQLPQWEKDGSNQNLSQREESISSQGLSHWGESARYQIHDKPLHPEKDKDTQTCAQQGPGSPSSVGTQVAAEAAWELPSAPALGSPTEDELAAAAVPAGAAEELEESLEHLAPEVEKAPGSPAGSDELPSAGTESPVPAPLSPPGCSPALLGLGGHISSEVVLRAVPEAQASGQQPEEQEDLEQSVAAELEAAAPGQREQSLSSAPHSPCCPPSPSPSPLGAQALRKQQEEAEWGSGLAEDEIKEGALAGELEHSQCKDEEHTELSQGEINKYQEGSQGEVCTEQELSLKEASSYQEGSQGKAYSEQELPQAESNRYQDKSQEEASTEKEVPQVESRTYQKGLTEEPCTEQEFPQEEATTYQEGSQGEASTEQEMSSAESGSHQEGSQGEASTEQELSSAESGSYQEEFQCCLHSIDQELFPEETGSYDEGPQGEACNEQELSLEEVGSYHELSSCDERVKKELSHGGDVGSYQEVSKGRIKVSKENQRQVVGSHNLSDWEEDSGHELFLGDVVGCQEVSDWEESIGQELSGGNGRRPSVESSWESDGDRDLVQDSWEERTRAKPLLQEDDDWDERSVIELREDEDRERIAAGLAGGRFFVPLPREAWVELGASGPCLGGPLCASSPHGEDPAPGGHAASPDFQEQVPKARRPPALRALRSLFCFPCLAPQPED